MPLIHDPHDPLVPLQGSTTKQPFNIPDNANTCHQRLFLSRLRQRCPLPMSSFIRNLGTVLSPNIVV